MAQSANDFFTSLAAGFRRYHVVAAAHQLGIFAALDTAADHSAAEVATRLGADERSMHTLLRALASMGIVEERGEDRYVNGALAAAHLVPGKPGYVGSNLRFQGLIGECWNHLSEVVRAGHPWKRLPDLIEGQDGGFAAEYIRGMQPISARQARALPRLLGAEPIHAVLDVGCGPGIYSLELAEHHPGLRATLLDLPTALEVTETLVRDHPAVDRVELLAGDYLKADFGSGYDLVLMSHVTHDESPANLKTLVSKAHAALGPGGRIAIHDWVTGAAAKDHEWAALFAVHVMVYTDGGQVYSDAEYARVLSESGFEAVTGQTVDLEGVANPTHLIVGRKPK